MNDALMRGFVSEMEKNGIGFLKGLATVGRSLGRAAMGSPGKTRKELLGQALHRGKQVMKKHPGKSMATAAGAGVGAGYLASK